MPESLSKEIDLGNFDYQNRQDFLASFLLRSGSVFCDLLLMMPILLFNYYNLIFLKSMSVLITVFTLLLILKVAIELKFRTSIGKAIFGVKIVGPNLRPACSKTILKRNILPITSFTLSIIHGILLLNQSYELSLDSIPGLGSFSIESILSLIILIVHFIFFVSFFCAALTPNRQTLYDLYAKSYCVSKKHVKYWPQ